MQLPLLSVNNKMALVNLFLLLTAFLAGPTTGSELRPSTVSVMTQGEDNHYTVKYTSPFQATVVWMDGPLIYDSSMVSITHSFTQGRGESTLVSSTSLKDPLVRVSLHEETAEFYYSLGEISGEFDLPETDLKSPLGQNYVYTPGVPFQVILHCTPGSQGFQDPYPSWYFVGIDNDRRVPKVELAAYFDPNIRHIVSNDTRGLQGSNFEFSAQVSLRSQEGLVLVYGYYYNPDNNFVILRTDVLYISQSGHQGPFPPDFVGVFNHLEFIGKREVECRNSVCSILCTAVGPDIERVELRKTGSENALVPIVITPRNWFYWAEYQIYPATEADDGTYTCIATNKNNRSAESELKVTVY